MQVMLTLHALRDILCLHRNFDTSTHAICYFMPCVRTLKFCECTRASRVLRSYSLRGTWLTWHMCTGSSSSGSGASTASPDVNSSSAKCAVVSIGYSKVSNDEAIAKTCAHPHIPQSAIDSGGLFGDSARRNGAAVLCT